MIAEAKTCISCQRSFHGRSDKKFCNDYCRNAYHNRLNGGDNNFIRNINHSLRRNRRILEGLLYPAKQVARISRRSLLNKGFSFYYFTHSQTHRKNGRLQFCYDYGYRLIGKETVVVVRRRNVEF